MNSPFLPLAGWLALGSLFFASASQALTVSVPGTSNPWLAGAADGTTAAAGDVAPNQSPVPISVGSGDELRFFVTGNAGYAPGTGTGPEGVASASSYYRISHAAENGIGPVNNVPANALVGVFLGSSAPVPGEEPAALDFDGSNKDSATRLPYLGQPFFIGNGLTSLGVRQVVYVPDGATRLFLGTMDGAGWLDNTGAFEVTLTVNDNTPSSGITWQTPVNVSGPQDVLTSGTLVTACNLKGGSTGNVDVTVNGVPFSTLHVTGAGGTLGAVSISSGTIWEDDGYGASQQPFTDLDAGYQTLLSSAAGVYGATSSLLLMLDGLTVGQEYTIQLWVNESTATVNGVLSATEYRTVISDVNSVSLDRNTGNQNGGTGQYVLGSFTAESASKVITLTASDSGYPLLNAFQLRTGGLATGPTITDSFLPPPGSSLTVTGGTAPFTFEITGGALPAGMTLSSSGVIGGAPTQSGNGSVVIKVTDANGLFSSKTFDLNVDIFVPEAVIRRVTVTNQGGTQRSASFEVVAGDDLALRPGDADPVNLGHSSLALEHRYRSGTGAFSPWQEQPYDPSGSPVVVFFDSAQVTTVEFRSIDAAGNRSRTAPYQLPKNIGAGNPLVTGASAGASSTLISNAGTSIVKLFAEDLNGDTSAEVAAVDRNTGKISIIHTSNRANPAANKQASLLVPQTPVTDAAVGKLLPLTGVSDVIPDFVVAADGALRIVLNNRAAAPVLTLSPTILSRANTHFTKVAVGDVNGDGFDDIIAAGDESGTTPMAVYLNRAGTGTAGFAAPVITYLTIESAHALTAGDINGDGVSDVLVAGHNAAHLPGDEVLCFLGQYNAGLSATSTSTFIGQEIVDLKVADHAQHLLGKKEVIVGTIEGPDATYPNASHMAMHRVLVHQGGGVFQVSPARRLAMVNLTAQEENSDKAVFNIAVGPLTDRVLPDIVGCQHATTGGSGTYDSGFLAPANALGELNWMGGNENGVVGFGTSTGKTRRIALADIASTGLPDVLLANADTGNIELQVNTKTMAATLPPTVVNAPSLKVPALASLVPGGRTNGANMGIAYQPWSFQYTIGTPPADLVAKVEFQLNNGAWSTLPGGTMTRSGNTLKATVPQAPAGWLRFRCVVSSASAGLYPSYSLPSISVRSIESQTLEVLARAEPESDPNGNTSTHDNEFITYRLTYANTGSAPASNVVLAGAVPANTTFGNGGSAGYTTDNGDPVKVKVVSWDLGTLAPGATGEKFYFVQVKSNALAVLKGKAVELKAMPATALSNPAATAGAFRTTTGTGGTFGLYSSAPAAGFKPQAATGSTVSTTVVPPLTMTQVVSSSSVSPGALVDVEIILRNHAADVIHSIKVEDFIEPSFVVEGVRLRTPANGTTGHFNGLLDTNPRAAQNPALQFRPEGRYLSWNVGSLDGVRNPANGQLRPPGECRIQYRLRVRYDVDPQQLVNDVLTARSLDYGGLSASGKIQGTNATTQARTDIMPRVATEMMADAGLNPPQISFVQDTVPLAGTNPQTATEPMVRQEMTVGGEDMAVVAEGGLMRVKLHYTNTGGTAALRSTINYSVPAGAEFLGFIRENGVAASLASNYEFFDGKNAVIPGTSLSARIREVRSLRVLLGNLAPASEGVVDFILAAYSPPVPKAANEKVTPAGTVIKSVAYTMETDSLVTPAHGTPEQVPVFVARPVSFDIESRPDQGQIVQTVGTPQNVRFLISYRNNGWVPASTVKVQASIPAGTTLISSQVLNADLTPSGTAGTALNTKNVVVANTLATKVEFNIGTLASGYEGNAGAFGYAEIVVQIPALLPSTFPKDYRLKQRCEITGTDMGTGKRAQGSYSLFSIPAGDDVKVLSGTSLSEVKLIPANAKLFAGKQVPSIVRPGQQIPIIVFVGNTGDAPIANVKVAVQVPWGTDFVSAGTTPGFTKFTDKDSITGKSTPNVHRWTFASLGAHSAGAVTMIVRVKNNAAYEGNYLFENSAVVTGQVGAATVERVPGNVRMLVLSTNPVASAWQWFGAQLQSIGSNLFGQSNAALKSSVAGINAETRLTAIAGVDSIVMPNGALIIPLQGGNVVAAGGGNIVASGGGNIVAGGAGNFIAGSGGNVIAAGAGNLINVTSVGYCTRDNLAGIVSGGAGNIIAAGGGNLIANDGASLIANDGASLGTISLSLASIIAAGGGNVVAAGGGNIVAAGGGNLIANDGAGIAETLASSRPGAALVGTSNGFVQSSGLIANDGGSLIANDGASLMPSSAAGILSDQGGGLIANDGGSLITQ